MIITPLKTEIIGVQTISLEEILLRSLPKNLPEKSIVVVSSKIVALCQGRVVPKENVDKEALLQEEADYYLPKENRLHGNCTITHHAFIGSAGIDESNAAGYYVLLPEDVQKTALSLASFLRSHYQLENIGVLITDSHSTPLRRGALGITLGYAGFQGLKDYRGSKDLFQREMKIEIANHVDALAASAVFSMGEGNEQTPLVLIEKLPEHFVFDTNAPTNDELNTLFVPLEDDIFSPLLRTEILKKGKKYKKK